MNRSVVSMVSRVTAFVVGITLLVSTAWVSRPAYASAPAARKPTKTPLPTFTVTPTVAPTSTPTSAPTATFTVTSAATNTAAPTSSSVLIYALYYDTYTTNEPEEAFSLINIGGSAVQLSGWQVTDGEGTVTFPSYSLPAGQHIWATKTATVFQSEFGFAPDFEYGGDSDPNVPDMSGTPPTFANAGDEMEILDASSTVVDTIVYEAGNTATTGWSGAAINPYTQGYFGAEGQILYRKLDEATGFPVADTNTASDWAQETGDNVDGKKIQYPGWDLEHFFFPLKVTQSAHLTYVVAPDNIYSAYVGEINKATSYIYIEGYTIDNADIADALVARLQAGVQVKILLEGEPVNGIGDQEKWICQLLEANGGQCWFMFNDAANGIHDRYAFQHSKFTVVDGTTLLTGSENLNYSSMPADDKSDGTLGNRGAYLITDASALISHALDIYSHDLDPANHKDLHRWDAATDSPTAGFVPSYASGGTSYAVQFPTPLVLNGTFDFEMIQSPENDLRSSDALLGMVARAGVGGNVFVEQLYERKYWGPSTSDPITDPNLRLEAYIEAARRGATVRILLDSFYDDPADPRGNASTCSYVNGLASSESLDLQCLTGNPAGTGIHNKMVLVWNGTEGWTHTGSINGSENSTKGNRELAVQVRSTDGYNYLAQVFNYDWIVSGGGPILPTPTPTTPATDTPTPLPTFTATPTATNTPTQLSTFTPTPTYTSTPSGPQYPLISEVFYDTPGTDSNEEWIELYNPTGSTIDLSNYKLGDEETQGGTEGMYQFPVGSSMAAGQKITVALKATGFFALYGFNPNYEVIDTDPSVPNMSVYSAWSTGTIALSNSGDEILLLNGSDVPVDVVTYESGSYPGVVPNPGVTTGHSIERSPVNQDTNDCSVDFIDQSSPTPGQ